MIALIQRVARASVVVDGRTTGEIGRGLLALIGVRPADSAENAARLAEKLAAYRVFPDEEGRMNRSLSDTGGALLLVPQFTLAADTRKGLRPSFSSAADPGTAQALFRTLVEESESRLAEVQTGVFGAHMQVSLVNDGPVTFWLEA